MAGSGTAYDFFFSMPTMSGSRAPTTADKPVE
jgi:hypothetical protein